MQDDDSFTSFPEEGLREQADPKVLSNIYTKMKSITNKATNAVTNVLPSTPTNSTMEEHNEMLSSSPFTGARIQALHQPDSPLKYLQDDVSVIASPQHKASPSLAGVTWGDGTGQDHDHDHDDDDMSGVSNATVTVNDKHPPHPPQLSRTASVNTAYSYNVRDHLPGYAIERDPSSDSESIVSSRDYIIANIDPRMNRSGGLGKEFWMKDENATDCFKCSKPFTTWRRKHHCRLCGQIFCSSCTELIPGEKFNYPGKMRACNNCLDVIDKYTSAATSESSTELPLSHDTTNPIEISFNSAPQPTPTMAIPATRKGEALEIFPNIETGSPRSQNSRSNVRDELDDNASAHGDVESEDEEEEDEQAMSLFTALHVDTKSDSNTSNKTVFRPRSSTGRSSDGRLMRLTQQRSDSLIGSRLLTSSSRNGLKGSRKSFRSSNVVSSPSVDLNKASINHTRAFLEQLLTNYELSNKWADWLLDILMRCSQKIDLDVRGGDSIDIRHYVKIKRIPGGVPKDITYIDGIVFSKTLALKTMPHKISNPRILLVTFPIEYTRSGQHFMSLDPVLAQENEYLKKLVRRIVSLDPQIVLVGERMSGIAVQLLDKHGIAVVHNVKQSTINRIARYTQADIISSIDKLAMHPRLGKCQRFEVKSYKLGEAYKTFLFFKGIPHELGCTVLLRGETMDNLANVKAVLEFMVNVVFSLKMETSLMRDQFVLVPSTDECSRKKTQEEQETGYFHDLVRFQAGKIMSSSPFVHFGTPYLLQEARELEHQLATMERESTALDYEDESIIKETYGKLGLVLGIDQLPGGVVTARELVKAVYTERAQRLQDQWDVQKRQWELSYSQYPYMFSAFAHQHIVTLYSVVSNETATPCIGPEQLAVDYYSDNDMTLGQFIEQACLTSDEPCPDGCGKPWSGHYRSYVNGRGRVNVVVENFECRLPGLQNTILMWSYCKECQNTMPVMPMSGTTWKYSFGKYLELSFWSDKISFRAGMCNHNIYRDHVRYFGFHDMAVRFEYDQIELLEVLVPRPHLVWKPEREVEHKLELYKSLRTKIQRFYNSVLSRLESVIVDNVASDKVEECRETTEHLKAKCERDQADAVERLKKLYLETPINGILPLNAVVRNVQESVVAWDAEFSEYENNYFPSEKDITRITAQQLKKIFVEEPDEDSNSTTNKSGTVTPTTTATTTPASGNDESSETSDLVQSTSSLPETSTEGLESEKDEVKESQSPQSPKSPKANNNNTKVKEAAQRYEEQAATDSSPRTSEEARRGGGAPSAPALNGSSSSSSSSAKPSSIPTLVKRPPAPVHSKTTPEKPTSFRKKFSDKIQYPAHSLRQRFGSSTRELERQLMHQNENGKQTKVSSLAKHFDQLSREFEKERARERTLMAQGRVRAFPVARARPIVEVFKNVQDAVQDNPAKTQRKDIMKTSAQQPKEKEKVRAGEVGPKESSKPAKEDQVKVGDRPEKGEDKRDEDKKEDIKKEDGKPEDKKDDEKAEDKKDDDKAEDKKDEEKRAEDKKDEEKNETKEDSQEMTHTAEKVSLMQALTRFWADRTSTGWKPLAYPLDHTEHVFAESDVIVREDEPSSLIAFCLSSADYIEKVQSNDEALESIMLKPTGMHLKYQFQEGSAMLSCKIFYAEQFDAFRKQCKCDQNYIQSLARCVKWDSSGGKSGSAFLKTLDDRLVVKELSPSELEAFLKFAPSYFEYMAQAFFHDLPTVLAKIFGFYQIQIRNPITGKTLKMDLIVMENLFYNRKMTRIFDLKGSMRNRHVQQTGKENEVLLDENMVEYIYESPLFVREYAKRLLRTSLFNDTLFLAKMNVMDYSLVIGIDSDSKQLVVGIIDFIRTFTWDKKLESWVKERGLVGGGGGIKEPTVVTPKQYKARFREAMERYVLMVPDCWFQDVVN